MERKNIKEINHLCIPKLSSIEMKETLDNKLKHKHIDNTWIYICQGEMVFHINQDKHIAKAGDMYFIQPGQTHSIDEIKEGTQYYSLRFFYLNEKEKQVDIFERYEDTENQIIKNIDGEFVEILEAIINENSLISIEAMIIYAINYLRRKWILRKKCIDNKEKTFEDIEDIINLLQYLNNSMDKKISYSKIAKELGINKRIFSKKFKDLTGMSIQKYIKSEKIEKAKLELMTTNKDIKYIADNYGFYDQAHFAKIFKKETGLWPSEFRKQKIDVIDYE